MASIRKRSWVTGAGDRRTAYIVDYVDNHGVRRRKQHARYKNAENFRIKIEGQLSNGTYRSNADKLTIEEVCSSFLDQCRGRMNRTERMTRKTLTVYQGHVSNHILNVEHGIGGYKLAHLTARPINDFRDRLRSSGVSVPTTRKILATLHATLEYAVSQDWIALNAARGVKVIGSRNEGPKKILPPSKAELKAILEVGAITESGV